MDAEAREHLIEAMRANLAWHEQATELLDGLNIADQQLWAAVAALRVDLRALSNRVEALTLALDEREHSVRVEP